MKQFASYGIIALLGIGLMIESPAIVEALVNFFAAGAIPGTHLIVGPSLVFVGAVASLAILIATTILGAVSISHSSAVKQKPVKHSTLPKHRYQHI